MNKHYTITGVRSSIVIYLKKYLNTVFTRFFKEIFWLIICYVNKGFNFLTIFAEWKMYREN